MNGSGKLALVTGGAGFVGSHLCERLVKEGYRVLSVDNYSTGTEANHVPGVEYRKGHTKDIEMHVPETPDILFHLGEYPRVEQSFDDIEKVLDSNVIGTKAVLEFARKRGTKFVYAGSSTKFADGGIGKDQSPYAWTKASNTELTRNYGEWFGLDYAITYFYNVYGPRERGDSKSGTVIGIFKERFEQGLPLTVRAPGTQRRNFTHIADIVEGLVRVGERGSGDEYGLGHPDSYSILEVAEFFGKEVTMLPERPGNRMDSKADVRRAEMELGWKPKNNLPDYIREITHHA
jgi:UDP-glucose 4-epimerase